MNISDRCAKEIRFVSSCEACLRYEECLADPEKAREHGRKPKPGGSQGAAPKRLRRQVRAYFDKGNPVLFPSVKVFCREVGCTEAQFKTVLANGVSPRKNCAVAFKKARITRIEIEYSQGG